MAATYKSDLLARIYKVAATKLLLTSDYFCTEK